MGQDCIYHFQTGKPGKRTSNNTILHMRSYIHSLGEYGVGNLGVGWEREGTGPIFFTKVQLQNTMGEKCSKYLSYVP